MVMKRFSTYLLLIGTLCCLQGNAQSKFSVSDETAGKCMKYVGYNQGYLVPGGNTLAWWEYSAVNAARIWADTRGYVNQDWFPSENLPADSLQFAEAKAAFRSAPLENMPLEKMDSVAGNFRQSTNSMVLTYALDEMKRLGIDVEIQGSIERRWYDCSWQHRWELWRAFYSQAFWCARYGGVQMFAICNEPDHRNAGPMPIDAWVILSKVASDAASCALQDVNAIYGTSYKSRFVGPVLAGNNKKWWTRVAAEQTDGGYIDILSGHSYNSPAEKYKGRITGINEIFRKNHPEHKTLPIVYTEAGRWMNASLINKEETMDSPSLFSEWGGIYAVNTMEGCYGIWAFKFGNTISDIYRRGVKSGHHHMWKGKRFAEDAFENLALGAAVTASSGSGAEAVTDGDKSSAWTSADTCAKWVEVRFPEARSLGGLAIYSGSEGGEFTAPDRIRKFSTEVLTADGWKLIKKEDNNKYAQVFYTIEPTAEALAIRLSIDGGEAAKLREIKAFGPNTLSRAETCFDVGGAHRTAEVVRLFAKGFKDERPLLKISPAVNDKDIYFIASRDDRTGNRYLWLVNRGDADREVSVDLSGIGVRKGDILVRETVSPTSYGEASLVKAAGRKQMFTLGRTSVSLVTIAPSGPVKELKAKACVSVQKSGVPASPRVEMNARIPEKNAVCYVSFDLSGVDVSKNKGRIVLGFHGASNTRTPFRFHVYGYGDALNPSGLKWQGAPHLDADEPRVLDAGNGVFLAGEAAMTFKAGWHWLDVTDAVRKYSGKAVTFLLARELREPGDDYDNGHFASIDGTPVLKIW